MKKRNVFLVVVLMTVFIPLALSALPAQDDPYEFIFPLNDGVVAAFQTAFSLGLLAIAQLAKNGLKKIIKGWDQLPKLTRHGIMYVLTAVISAGVTYFILTQMGLMGTGRFILYALYAWGVCNGFWKALKELIKKHS